MIALVDYGLGNIQAFANIFTKLNLPVVAATTPDQLLAADKYILPGVGAFDRAMTKLNESGMREVLDAVVVQEAKPVLGVCVGMQMMARSSEEGDLPGLDWIDAEVRRFSADRSPHKTRLPHMGWNDVHPRDVGGLFGGMEATRFYFLHSYVFEADHPSDVLATTDYSGVFTSAVRSRNVYGTQFHPEKSHSWGIRLLKNFADL